MGKKKDPPSNDKHKCDAAGRVAQEWDNVKPGVRVEYRVHFCSICGAATERYKV